MMLLDDHSCGSGLLGIDVSRNTSCHVARSDPHQLDNVDGTITVGQFGNHCLDGTHVHTNHMGSRV